MAETKWFRFLHSIFKKKTSNKRKKNIPTIHSLPVELITEIVARVAASSSNDLFNLKFSCKTLKQVADNKYVLHHVSLDKFPVVQWFSNKKESLFLDLCTKYENPEALYRLGVRQYFGKIEIESGMKNLSRAANLGHLGAMYVTGIIFIIHEDELKPKGMKMISDMKKLKTTRNKVINIRENFIRMLYQSLWGYSNTVFEHKTSCCTRHVHATGWTSFDEIELECEACLCDQEIYSIVHPKKHLLY